MAYKSNAERLFEVVADNYAALEGTEVARQAFAEHYGQPPRRLVYINAYERTQGYGGPEEGGWWYDIYEPVAAIPVRDLISANAAIGGLDAWLEWRYGDEIEYTSASDRGMDGVMRFEDRFPVFEPVERPHYE